MSKKLLALDIDGTLTNTQKDITPATLEKIIEAQEKGHIVAIASGRPLPGIRKIADTIELDRFGGYVLAFNGGRIVDYSTGEVVYQAVLDNDVVRDIYDYCLKAGCGMESNMELQILHAIQGIHQEWLTEILRFFTTMGESGLVWIVIAIVLTCIPKTRKCGLTMMIAMAVTYLVGNLFLKNVIARPRPCAVDTGVTLKIPFPSEYSFPSGHTSNGFAAAVTIFSYYRKAGILSLLVAAIIAFSRLYFFVHYPTDILGGMVLGTLDAVLAVYIVKRLEDRVDVKTISDNDKTGHK